MFDKTFKILTRVRGEGILFSVRPDPSIDLTGRVYNFTIWTAIGKVTTNVESKDGELSKDESGNPVFLWNFKGELTERLYLLDATINWSLNDRLNDKIEYIRGGTITIIQGPSTLTMDNDAGAEARYIDRITIKENPEDQDNPANYTVVTLPYTATPAPVPAPVNSVAPAISGTAQVGSVLTVSNGTWTGSPTSFTYVWKVGGTTVSGATSAAYTPVSGDVGKTVTATVTAVNAGGSTSATSAATSAVVAAPVSNALKIALAGSSSPAQYANDFTGGTQNSRNQYTSNGTTFSPATTGRVCMDAGNIIISALNRDVRWFRGGVGGTTLSQWIEASSTYRSGLVNIINAGGGVDVIVIQVGFNDIGQSLVGTTAEQVAKLRQLISQFRSETNLPNLKIVINGTQDRGPSFAGIRAVREAEMIVANTDTNVWFGGQTYDLATSDTIHQTEASNAIFAPRMAAQILAAVNGSASKRGARVTSVNAVSDTVTDATITHNLGTDFTPTSGISGFVVFNNAGTSLAISAAVRQSANTIRLAHASRNGNAGTLVYMPNGDASDDATIVRDNGTLTLPLEVTAASFTVGTTVVAPKTVQMSFRMLSNPYVPTGWNAVMPSAATVPTTGVSMSNLLDTTGANSGWSVAVGTFNEAASQGPSTGNNSGVYPDLILGSYFYNAVGGAAEATDVTISGLNPAKTYELSALPARASAAGRPVLYTVAGTSKIVDAGGNTTNVATFSNLTPSADGKIVLNWKRDPSSSVTFGYLNALVIKENASSGTSPTERSFSYSETEPGWTLIRDDTYSSGTRLQLNNTNDFTSASHYYAVINGSSAAAKLNSVIKTTAAQKSDELYFEVSIDGAATYTKTPYNSATDDYQLFSGLSDGPHTVAMRTPAAIYESAYLKKADSQIRVTGSSPSITNVTQWIQPGVANANVQVGNSMLSGNFGGSMANPVPKIFGDYNPGASISMVVRANVTELVFVTGQRMVHVWDGSTMQVVDTGYDPSNGSSSVRVGRLTGLSGLKTYNIWTNNNGNITFFSLGLVGGTAQPLTLPKRTLSQFGDSITQGTINNNLINGRGYVDTFRVAARLGYAGDINGIGGYTVSQLKNNLDDWLLRKTVTSADVALVAIGQNGGTDVAADYNAIIDKLLAKGYGKVICRGVLPVAGNGHLTPNQNISGYVSARADARVKYMDPNSWTTISRPDGIHPDITGYGQIVEYSVPALTTLLS